MRVLYVTTGSLSNNGSIQRAVHLARAGIAFGIESKILILDVAQNRNLVKQHGLAMQVHWVRGRNISHYFAQRSTVAWCQVIHLIAPTLAGMALSLEAHRLGRFVLSDWDELYLAQADRVFSRIRRCLLQWGCSAVTNGYIFASRALQQWYLQRDGNKPNTYIPYGLWPLASSGALQERHENGSSGWVFYLGGYHRVYREDLCEVIELARIAAKEGLGLILAGQGMELPALKAKLIKILPSSRLKVLGFVQDVDDLLRDPEIKLCFLPLKDTLQNRCRCPNKIFHYALAGKMVLTNRVGEVWEIFGDQVEYYDFVDPESMQAAFTNALSRHPNYDFPRLSWHERARDYRAVLERFIKPAQLDPNLRDPR